MAVSFKINGVECFVDDVDADLIDMGWALLKQPKRNTIYLSFNRRSKKSLRMHKVIMERVLGRDLDRHELVDHKDLNGLNNTRENLRIATHTQNQINRGLRKDNTTGVKGVYLRRGKYTAKINVNKKQITLGTFETIEAAHETRRAAVVFHYGEFARED